MHTPGKDIAEYYNKDEVIVTSYTHHVHVHWRIACISPAIQEALIVIWGGGRHWSCYDTSWMKN